MENARLYSKANALQRTDARRILQEVIESLNLKPGARVLDVGCGSGDVTAEVLLPALPDVKEVVAVDVSERMISHARKVYPNPRLSFVQCDFEGDLKNNNESNTDLVEIFINGMRIDDNERKGKEDHSVIEEGKFDAVFSFYCLHWIQNQRQALENIFYVLKTNGQAVLAFLANSSIFSLYETMAGKSQWAPYMKDYKKFISPYCTSDDPARDFSELASSVGFQVVSVERQKRDFVYRDKTAVKEAMKAVNPFVSRLSASDAKMYLNDCLEIVKMHQLADHVNEGVRVNYTLLVARLRKC